MLTKFGIVRVWRQKNVNVYFFTNVLLYFFAWITQTKNFVMMTNEEFTKLVKFMTTGAVIAKLGRGHITHTVKRHITLKKEPSDRKSV